MNSLISSIAVFITIIYQIRGESIEVDGEDIPSHLKEFYTKYCSEKDIKVLEKIHKCEEPNPPEIKKLEDSCYEKIRGEQGKTGEITLQEYQSMECDPDSSQKFEKCMNETLTVEKMNQLEKDYPKNKLDKIQKDIMYCDCDVYGIKHNKN